MYTIYCSEQLDGVCAAAIVLRYARLRGTQARIGGFINYNRINDDFTQMASHNGNIYFILDISPEQIKNVEITLRKITSNNKIVYWNSHHPYDVKTLDVIKSFVAKVDFSGPLKHGTKQKTELCSAELAFNTLLPGDFVAKRLAEIAHDIEFWKRKDEEALKLADLMTSSVDKKDIADVLSRGVFWSQRFEYARKEYLEKREKAFEDLLKKIRMKQYLGANFAFTLASSILPTADAGQKVLDNVAQADVSVVVYRDGRISFRRRNTCSIDLSKLAKEFEGGGHSYAAGGRIEAPVTVENFEKVLFNVDQRIKDVFFR